MNPLLADGPSLAMSTSEQVLFWIVAPIVVIGALALLFSKRAIITACSVMLTMVGLAFLYVGMDAPFLGAVQVVVYTGAIMMLFVFVLMLVGVDVSDSFVEVLRGQRFFGALVGIGLMVVLTGAAVRAIWPPAQGVKVANGANPGANPGALAKLLFSDFAFTLEVTGCLLIIAAMGAVVMTHRERLARAITQRERAEARIRRGVDVAPLPSPGVYARHNAADIPAVDPDGKPIEQSVAAVLRMRGQVHRLHGAAEDLLPAREPTKDLLPAPEPTEEKP